MSGYAVARKFRDMSPAQNAFSQGYFGQDFIHDTVPASVIFHRGNNMNNTTNTNTTTTTTANLADWLSSQKFEVWVGMAGYDTRPYYVTPEGRGVVPVEYAVGFADGRQCVEYEGAPNDALLTLETLHTWGVEIVVPDYHGSHHCGSLCWIPTEYGWASFYESGE